MVHDQLKPAIQRKYNGLLSSGICLQHDNPPTSNDPSHCKTVSGFKTGSYPICHIHQIWHQRFSSLWLLKDTLHGCQFRSGEKVKEAVLHWPTEQPKDFFLFFRRYNFREVLAFSTNFFPFGAVFDAVPPIGNFHFCYITFYIILPPVFRSS
jgi:hypothetical protein